MKEFFPAFEPYDKNSPQAKRAVELLKEAQGETKKAEALLNKASKELENTVERYRIDALSIDAGKLAYATWMQIWRLTDGTVADDAPRRRAD